MKYVIFLILVICSCSKQLGNDELSLNQSKWNVKKSVNYQFTLRVNCFCPMERVGPHIIKVSSDTIVSVNNLPYDVTRTGKLMTINQLFDFIKICLDQKPYRNTVYYDPIFGFPQSIYFDFNKEIADEEIGFQITDFKTI